jgi:hypothetical protein
MDGHDLVDLRGWGGRLVGDPHGPPARQARSADRDVATEAHQRGPIDLTRDTRRGPVGRESLGRRAEVEKDAARDAHRAGIGVEVHVAEAGHRAEDVRRGGRSASDDLVEIAVVAEGGDCVAHRGVDGTGRATGHSTRHIDGLVEQGADADGDTGARVEGGKLRVVTKPAARFVHGVELGRQCELGRFRRARIGNHDGGRGADGAERAHGERGGSHVEGGHDDVPPEVTEGVDELLDGAVDEEELEPENKEEDESDDDESDDDESDDDPDEVVPDDPVPEDPDPEDPDPDDADPDDPDEVEGVVVTLDPDPAPVVVLVVLLEPGCSRATTTPMKAAMPVAAKIAARVSTRTRAWARSLDAGVLG